jgi:integrase
LGVYVKDLRGRLDKFADSFQVNIDEVTGKQIEEFLGAVKGSGRTQFNYGRLIRTLFNFAEKRNYLAMDSNPFADIDLGFNDDSEIEIFNAKEMQKIMETARPEMIPFFALGGFAGLRHAEIKRLDWSKIGPAEHPGHIEVTKAENKKTRTRRLVPIQPNLAKWLEPHRQKTGPVVQFAHTSKQIGWMVDDANEGRETAEAEFEWKHNAMRHSFISYRLAVTNDENKVALESGNSPAKIHANYKALVTPDAANAWFAIVPQSVF